MKARDAAIVGRLRIAPATLGQLLTIMPIEPGHADSDRETACRSALIRLGVKKVIRAAGDGWAIV